MPMIKCETCKIREELDLSIHQCDWCTICKELLYKKRVHEVAIESIKHIERMIEKLII